MEFDVARLSTCFFVGEWYSTFTGCLIKFLQQHLQHCSWNFLPKWIKPYLILIISNTNPKKKVNNISTRYSIIDNIISKTIGYNPVRICNGSLRMSTDETFRLILCYEAINKQYNTGTILVLYYLKSKY